MILFSFGAQLIENIVSLAVAISRLVRAVEKEQDDRYKHRLFSPLSQFSDTHLLSFAGHINQRRSGFSSLVFRRDVQDARTLNDADVWIWHNQLVRINNFAGAAEEKGNRKMTCFL